MAVQLAKIIDTISKLKGEDPSDYHTPTNVRVALVKGFSSDQDGGGGFYYWAAGDTDPADGADVVESSVDGYGSGDANEGKWRRLVDGYNASVSVEIKVPSHASTLSGAIDRALARTARPVTITIESGHTVSDAVSIENADCSHVTIESEDATVSVTMPDSSTDFFSVRNGISPKIDCIFDLGDTGKEGITLLESSKGYITSSGGCINAGRHNLRVEYESFCQAQEATLTGAGERGVYAHRGGHVNAHGADVSDAGTVGFGASSVSTINCEAATATNCGSAAVSANFRSSVDAEDINGSGSVTGANANRASSINVRGADLSGCTDGITVDGASTVNAFDADVSSASNDGVYADNGSRVSFRNGDASSCGRLGVAAQRGSTVVAEGATATDCDTRNLWSNRGSTIHAAGATLTTGNVDCLNGAIINLNGASYDGDQPNLSLNTVTSDGIIFG